MTVESLANELFLELFEYLDIPQLFHAFYGLNTRFNELLLVYFQLHGYYNFESISKRNFGIICEDYLPLNFNRIISIHLSNNNETPQQINHFLTSYGFQFHQFINLKSLSLSHIQSEQILINIITDLHQLHYLTHLKINKCRVDHDLINSGWIFDQIWSLSKLISCHFEQKRYLWKPFFISPKTISLSIKYLYLEGFSYNSKELHHLFEHTINLEKLNINVEHDYDYREIPFVISSIKRLQISVRYSPHVTNQLLKYMPNLTHLIIQLEHIVIDGNQWKEIIDNYLLNLKVFHLKMEFYPRCNNQINEQINQLVNSFRSQFWIDKHQWYVQCHWNSAKKVTKAYLYTLPYYFKDFTINSDVQFQSTYEIDWCYDNVYNLSVNNSIDQPIRFKNVEHLKVHLPCDDYFSSIVPNLDRLISLNMTLSNDVTDQLQFENLLQRATRLYSLVLTNCLASCECLFNIKNPSIRRLCLYDFGCFNEERCDSLIYSPLGIQCEVLFITVNDRINILTLVNGMKNLRVLNVRSQDDKWDAEDDELSTEDELVKYLEDCLPKTCTITRGNKSYVSNIQLWIC